MTALAQAEENITEKGEKESIELIHTRLQAVQANAPGSRRQLALAIRQLNNYNHNAIIQSARQAQQLRQAGAWGIVFMTLLFFAAALYYEQRIRRTLLTPLQEISLVLEARHHGDLYRRCNPESGSEDIKKLLSGINDLLDKHK